MTQANGTAESVAGLKELAEAPVVTIPDLPMPEGGRFLWLERPRGVKLRFAVWPVLSDDARGTVYIVSGRTEFIEKYFEVVGELRARGYAVVVMDVRGQGLSTRLLNERWKGHVLDFADYVADLAALVDITKAEVPGPALCLAHSMGGHIALRFVHDYPDAFSRLVTTAPMIDIGLPGGTGFLARVIAYYACVFGASGKYVLGTRNPDPLAEPFEGNVLTHDRTRFEWVSELWRTEPGLAVGPPTFGWLAAAFRSIALLTGRGYAERIACPVLMFRSGEEKLVSNAAIARFTAQLSHGAMVDVEQALHEVMMETDDSRATFWQRFDGFMRDV